jgi:hypothetical protein
MKFELTTSLNYKFHENQGYSFYSVLYFQHLAANNNGLM